MKKKKSGAKKIIIIIFLALVVFLSLIGFITNFLWFNELGYLSVFLIKLFTQLKIGVPAFVALTLIGYIYLKFLKRGYLKKVQSSTELNHKRLNLLSWGLSAVFGALGTYVMATTLWLDALKFFNSTSFGKADPLYKMDISFYVFKLDFINELNQLVIGLIIGFAVLTVLYYLLLLSLRPPQVLEEQEEPDPDYFDGETQGPQNGTDAVSDMVGKFVEAFTGKKPAGGSGSGGGGGKQLDKKNLMQLVGIAEKQLIFVGILFFIMVGIHFFLKQFDLLYGSTGVVHGAGYTDIHITLWVYRSIMILSILAAITFGVGVAKRKMKTVLAIPVIMVLVGILGAGTGFLVQSFIVSPDEISKESKYLEWNIDHTQAAYNLDSITNKPFAAKSDLTGEDIANNTETLTNIRINDYQPAEKFYNSTQNIRTYYTFPDVDVDRYMINGNYTQTFLSAREIDESKISNTWLNQHVKYTHGYGITLSRVDQITANGQPDILIKNIPPESDVKEIQLERPEIYFGQQSHNYILVNTDEDEFDYPGESSNEYAQYKGTAGIKLNALNKTLFSIRERSLKMFVSSILKSDSKIVINRNIQTRVQTIMPYLNYDEDPYVVTVDGKLYWIMDAYTSSNKFPYSEAFAASGTNYIRNSIKVVIDAYNGTTDFFIVDSEDPIAATYQKIYPKLFKDFSEMPESLKAHIRYPSTLLDIQANTYKRYHMTDVKVFYQNEDYWDIAKEIYGTAKTDMKPNYYIMKLPGEKSAEFVNTIPYTPKDKINMMGLLIARNDGDNYGKLMLYRLPKSKIVFGPEQIESRINQNSEISKEFSLWDSAGSKYSRGNMFVVPIEDSLLYVEPVYLEATNSSIPEVRRVIVVYGNEIAYEANLTDALNSLFGDGSAKEVGSPDKDKSKTPETETLADLIKKAQDAFDNAQKAQQKGDWAAYGKYQKELENYLKQLANK